MQTTFASVVVNDLNEILTYTIRATAQQVEEHAIELWGEEVWCILLSRGAQIVPCEIIVKV